MTRDAAEFDRLLAGIRYLVLATTDDDGAPWVSPVFFAPHGADRIYWVSSPDARHSRNVERRPAVALTVFDSTVDVGRAEAAYADARAARAEPSEAPSALVALNERLPAGKKLGADDLAPEGPMQLYRADLGRRYLLARGGDPELGNQLDTTVAID